MRRGTIATLCMLGTIVAGCDTNTTDRAGEAGREPIDECDWAMFGHDLAATWTQPCETEISPDTVDELQEVWFFDTRDAVSGSPTVVDDSVYFGDWSGRVYALRADTGEERWTFDAEPHDRVYAGQIVGSVAVDDVGEVRTVFIGAGKTMYALDADDGSVTWRHELGREGDGDDPTEIESSPIVADGKVIFGYDVHNSPNGEPAGIRALDAASGDEVWTFETAPTEGEGATGEGCGDVWGSVSVDEDLGLIYFGTGNCTTEEWGRFSEALVAVTLDSGELAWSHQPHEQNFDDLDFAGQPNLFDAGGRALVGLGNKDGTYYAVDRETGEEVWRAEATGPGLTNPGSNFSTGGFIGTTAFADGLVVGGTAVGPPPHLHAIDAASGEIAWQNPAPAATYAPTTIANGVAFLGGTDFTLRAYDAADGEIRWEHTMAAVVAGGAVVVGNDVFAVSGLREPGLEASGEGTGVTRFSLDEVPAESTSTSTAPDEEPTDVAAELTQRCLGEPCSVPFNFTEPPPGTDPQMDLLVELDPWKVTVTASGLGPPSAWVRAGSPDAAEGASAYAIFLSESDSNPVGGLVCVLDEDLACETTTIPRDGATYNRITLLAVADASEIPEIASGINRLVTTISFDPPMLPQP